MKHIPTFDGFLNEKTQKLTEGLDVNKNANKLAVFGGILPVKIIHTEESNSYNDSGSNVTDKIVPDLNNLEQKYILKHSGNKLILAKSSGAFNQPGHIQYDTEYGANRIISYQNSSMIKQNWHLNFIFKPAEEAKTAFDNLLKKYTK